jgi:hypothetical protein
MTVAELLGRMSSRELSEWIAFYSLKQKEETQRDLQHKAEQNMNETKNKTKSRTMGTI